VTEYAGSVAPMQGILDAPGRFGSQSELAATGSDVQFLGYMLSHGYPLTSKTIAVLQKYIPVPPLLAQNQGIQPPQFYQNLSYWLGSYRSQNPGDFVGWAENFQPVQMAQDLQDRVVTPTLAAGALFEQFPYLTRLYTTLSPEDMNKDPVFSYNPGLKDWPNVHNGVLTYHCGFFGDRGIFNTAATLRTEAGWVIEYPNGTGPSTTTGGGSTFTPPGGPSSQRIEILRETGNPEVVTDNTASISNSLGGGGCGVTVGARASRSYVGFFGLLVIAGLMLLGRRRAS
jgi:MYXO-CTERM domain-containing protein